MFLNIASIIGCEVRATDKPAGKVADVLVDDVLWTLRHVTVADAGGLGTQAAMIDPANLGSVDTAGRVLSVALTQDQVAGGQDSSTDLPVSEQSGGRGDPHLRSLKEITGYAVHGPDGPIGTLAALIADDEAWKIHFVAIDTGDWNDSRTVLVAPGMLNELDHEKHNVHSDLDRDHISRSPDYDPATPIENEADVKLAGRVGI